MGARGAAIVRFHIGAVGDAEHRVMRGVEIRLGVTDRVGRDQRQVAGIGKVDQRVFGGRFHRIITAHDLDIEPVREDLLKLVQRSEEHTSELQSLMRLSYAVFCLKKKKKKNKETNRRQK